MSDVNGEYLINYLLPGVYSIKAEKEEYLSKTVDNITITPELSLGLDIIMVIDTKYVLGSDNVIIANNIFNPRRGQSARVMINVSVNSKMVAKVYNLSGLVVKDYPETNIDTGNYEFLWDGKDGNGDTVPAGMYFVYLKTDTFEKVEKVLIIRR